METCRIFYFVTCIMVVGYVVVKHLLAKNEKKQEVELSLENEEKKKEDLQYNLELVNSWLNNCDQKAGILLTVVGVAATVILTSDFMKFLREYVFVPFMDFCLGNHELSFSWGRFTIFILLVIAAAILTTSLYYLFKAISANIGYEKMYNENPELVKTSYIFYGTISGMKYDDYKKGGVKYEEDLKSQIYVNSKIAIAKFENYNEGLFWFKLLLLVSVMLFLVVMFVK